MWVPTPSPRKKQHMNISHKPGPPAPTAETCVSLKSGHHSPSDPHGESHSLVNTVNPEKHLGIVFCHKSQMTKAARCSATASSPTLPRGTTAGPLWL